MSVEVKNGRPVFLDKGPKGRVDFQIHFKDGEPRHICHISIGQRYITDCVLTKDLLDPEGNRKIVLVPEWRLPKRVLMEHQPYIDLIKNRLHEYKQKYNLGDVSAHKALTIDIAQDKVKDLPNVIVCNHKFGAVASYFIGYDTKDTFLICVHPRMNEVETDTDKNNGLLIRLRNYQELDLIGMLSQYLADATFYLESIFRASSHEIVIRYCRKIREILGESFDSKIDDIYKHGLSSPKPEIKQAVENILTTHRTELRMLKFCREFIQLLVNYVYSFLNFREKLRYYRTKLDEIISKEKDCEIPDAYRVLINTYQRLERNDDIEVPDPSTYDEWIRILIWVARKIQFVKRAIMNHKLDFSNVNVFLSHHMSVPNSLYFSCKLQEFVQEENIGHVNVIRGCATSQELIHDTVEALIWLSDALFVYIPADCRDFFGKPVENHEWIIKEALYAKMQNKPVTFIFEKPNQFDLNKFFNQLNSYVSHLLDTNAEGIGLSKSNKNKLRKQADELKNDMQMKYRIEYTPSYRFDEIISQEIKRKFEEISIHKCLMLLKMVRLWFKRKTWYPLVHIHRLSKHGKIYVTKEQIIEALLKDKRAPYQYKNKTEQQLRKMLDRIIQKYTEPILKIGGKYYSLIEVNSEGNFRSNVYEIIVSIQNKYNIAKDLTSAIESHIERSDILA